MTKAMRPEDVAALFDLPALPTASLSAESTTEATEAAEAALAAEIMATIESGGIAADAPDSRTNLRVQVAWPARMQLPDGQVIELEVRNVSAVGVGLTSDERIPAHTVVNFEMDVPAPGEDGKTTLVKGAIRTTYTTAHGTKILCGGAWQAPPAGLELVTMWIQRLWR